MNPQQPISIIIRVTGGIRNGVTKKFQVTEHLSIKIGRGENNDIAFDPSEDIVSREHCVIKKNPDLFDTYEISDLGSKNGTYVNGKAIAAATALIAGDQIQLGRNGPSLEFDLDPRPASHIRKTRVIDAAIAKETQVHSIDGKKNEPAPAKEAIGKQTMQHMLQQSEKKSKKGLLVTTAALLILVATVGWLVYSNKPAPKVVNIIHKDSSNTRPTGLTPAQINKANEQKVVLIELGWKLELTSTGEELYHVYLSNGKGGFIAAYIKNNLGAVEPYLATKSEAPKDADLVPIGGFGSGTGFVVDDRGFIITNRHVAASWLTSYNFPQNAFPGILIGTNSKEPVFVYQEDVGAWIPAEAMNYNRRMLESGIKIIDGSSAYLDVTFANNSLRTPAKVVRISNVHDVAMIKIELPETLSKVEMYDNYNQVETGDEVTVMGYPGLSPDQYVANRSQDHFNRNPNIVKVPVPTLSTGNVGRLVKGRASSDKIDEYLSALGDYYQLTINSTGVGNSGGPTFDNQGRVIGIYSAGSEKISFAIPIKYAIELMGRQEVIR